VDLATLERLASSGFDAVSGVQLRDLAAWCWDWGVATGDARYCVISVVLGAVDRWWDEQGVPQDLLLEVEQILQRGLTDSLAAPDAASGAQLAHEMGSALPLPVRPSEWRAGGWL
jgi:hypothetical protein